MQEIILVVFFWENKYVENRTQDDEVQLLFGGELGAMRAKIEYTWFHGSNIKSFNK